MTRPYTVPPTTTWTKVCTTPLSNVTSIAEVVRFFDRRRLTADRSSEWSEVSILSARVRNMAAFGEVPPLVNLHAVLSRGIITSQVNVPYRANWHTINWFLCSTRTYGELAELIYQTEWILGIAAGCLMCRMLAELISNKIDISLFVCCWFMP